MRGCAQAGWRGGATVWAHTVVVEKYPGVDEEVSGGAQYPTVRDKDEDDLY